MVVKNGDESHGIKKKSPESKSKRIRANLYFRFYLNTLNMDSMKVSNNLLPFIKNGHSFQLSTLAGFGQTYSIHTWNSTDPFFHWKKPCFGGLKPQNWGETGSRYNEYSWQRGAYDTHALMIFIHSNKASCAQVSQGDEKHHDTCNGMLCVRLWPMQPLPRSPMLLSTQYESYGQQK